MLHLVRNLGIALALVAVTACSSNFAGNGTQTAGAPVPPIQPQAVTAPKMPEVPKKAADANGANASADTATFAFSQAPAGLQCPQQQGYTCELKFNMPSPSPSPEKGKHANHKATPSPSPSPSPTPTPASSESPSASESPSSSGSPKASASPSEAQITLRLQAQPSDAPPMKGADDKKPSVALVAVRMSVSADEIISGAAEANFTLPQEQLAKGRGFAIELFHETTGKHNKHTDTFEGSYSTFDVDAKTNTLHFSFDAPPLQVKKGETWLFVLYGDQLASPSPNPSSSPNPSESPTPTAS